MQTHNGADDLVSRFCRSGGGVGSLGQEVEWIMEQVAGRWRSYNRRQQALALCHLQALHFASRLARSHTYKIRKHVCAAALALRLLRQVLFFSSLVSSFANRHAPLKHACKKYAI